MLARRHLRYGNEKILRYVKRLKKYWKGETIGNYIIEFDTKVFQFVNIIK